MNSTFIRKNSTSFMFGGTGVTKISRDRMRDASMVLNQFYTMQGVSAVAGLQKNGVSTTRQFDCFRYETFIGHGGKEKIQWDYRDRSGELHSSICNSLETAKEQAAKHGYIQGISLEE